jgi:agmatinase
MSAEEAAFIGEGKVKTFHADFVFEEHTWWKEICENLSGDIYVTIDLDVLDSSIMPATEAPEPGGISWREILRLMKEVSSRCRVRGFDVTELAPIPGMIAPDFLAAKLVYRIMGYQMKARQDVKL